MRSAADDYELFDDQPTGFARWVVPALVISVLVHVIFYMWASGTEYALSDKYFDRIVPRTFQIERVEIDPALLEPSLAEEKQPAAAPEAVTLPEETVSFEKMMDDVKASPAVPQIDTPMLAEKPKVEPTTLAQTVEAAEKDGAQSVVRDMDALREELLVDRPEVSGRPLLEMGEPGTDPSGTRAPIGPAAGASTPGFSNLDALLADTGPLTDETAPILMPADFLYDYDSYQLRQAAVASLQKLGMLIQKNPQADFVIEGHTDSFGGDAYNGELSRRRAESVKQWLVQAMGVDPRRIQTRGYGKSRLIAPAVGSIDEQQINRRVEVVIRSRGTGR